MSLVVTSRARKPFVVMSGLPGSGKTTLGRRLAPALGLPLIDKDDILERLFDSKGVGNAAWRRTLSRESDVILQQEATDSDGAIVSSFWRLPGMQADSGTPTDWLADPSYRVVNVHCGCELEVAASRFHRRRRHPGHLDGESRLEDVALRFRQLTQLPPLDVGPRIDVDTSGTPNFPDVVAAIRRALNLST
jgi:predicted kinase